MRCPSCGEELEKHPYYINIDTTGLSEENRHIVHLHDNSVDYYFCKNCAVINYDSVDRFKLHFHHSDNWYQYGVKGWTLIKNPIIDEKVIFT